MVSRKNIWLWVFVGITFWGVVVPILITDGMFMDGMLYTCVSKNLANGYGSFWFPKFSESWWVQGRNSFHEHPPMVFAIQALFFKLLGDSMYVERFYIFLTAVLTSWLIVLHWNQIYKENDQYRKMGWLPVFLWLAMPLTFWTFHYNMQENTMGIFILGASFFLLKGFQDKSRIALHIITAGILIFFATFSKGLPGLFPLSFVFFYWLVFRDISFLQMAAYTLLLLLVPVTIYAALITISTEAYSSLSFYFTERVLHRVNANHTVTHRLFTIKRLFDELIPVFGLTAILLVVFWKKGIRLFNAEPYRKIMVLFFLIAASGSLPLTLTKVQKGFYLTPSIPFYAIGFAVLLSSGIHELLEKIKPDSIFEKIFGPLCLIYLSGIVVFTFTQIGKFDRHEALLHDVYKMGKAMPRGTTVSFSKDVSPVKGAKFLSDNMGMQCYFMRYFEISMDYKTRNPFWITTETTAPLPGYERVDLPTKEFHLYQLKKNGLKRDT